MSTCRDCHAEVLFVPSAKTGKPMILDAKPKKGVILGHTSGQGFVLCRDRPFQASAGGWPCDTQLAAVVDVYTDHHATCTVAAWWKGRIRRDPPVQDPDGGRRGD